MDGENFFCKLPEGCISDILSLTSPQDACRSSLVSLMFKSASESDAVWERFLPSDYRDVLSRSVSPVKFSSKKDLYLRLCAHSILVDHGKMSFSLERRTGKKCYMLGARELLIVWGDTPSRWRWIPLPSSRFPEVAELLNVSWLEIHGKINTQMLSPKTTYAAYVVLNFVQGSFGLNSPAVQLSIKAGSNVSHETAYLLDTDYLRQQHQRKIDRLSYYYSMLGFRTVQSLPSVKDIRIPRERSDGWMEIELGEFFNDDGGQGEVEMSLMEVKSGKSRGGLIIQGIELRPKD